MEGRRSQDCSESVCFSPRQAFSAASKNPKKYPVLILSMNPPHPGAWIDMSPLSTLALKAAAIASGDRGFAWSVGESREMRVPAATLAYSAPVMRVPGAERGGAAGAEKEGAKEGEGGRGEEEEGARVTDMVRGEDPIILATSNDAKSFAGISTDSSPSPFSKECSLTAADWRACATKLASAAASGEGSVSVSGSLVLNTVSPSSAESVTSYAKFLPGGEAVDDNRKEEVNGDEVVRGEGGRKKDGWKEDAGCDARRQSRGRRFDMFLEEKKVKKKSS